MARTPKSAPELEQVGWSVPHWSNAVDGNKTQTYALLNAGIIKGRRVGHRTIITTPPKEYLVSCPEYEPGGKLRGGVEPAAARRASS